MNNNQKVYDWIEKNREKHNKRMALYMRERNKTHPPQYTKNLRIKLLKILGDKCVRCGFNEQQALQIDHISGNGYIERKFRFGALFYKYYIDNQDKISNNLQILCANCNKIKQIKNKEYKKSGRPKKY